MKSRRKRVVALGLEMVNLINLIHLLLAISEHYFYTGTIKTKLPRLIFNTASFVDPNGVYELIVEIGKDDRFAYASFMVTVSEIPPPAVQITLALS